MHTTVPIARPRGRRRAVLWLALPLAALSLALPACSQNTPEAEPTEQETAVQSATSQPTPSEPAPGSGASTTRAKLTVTLKQDAASEPVQYVLECVDGRPGPASTLPNADAACARLSELGAQFFTARPNKEAICTQQYGGPQTASVTGEIDGTSVVAAFALTDGCEISRWNRARDILGAPGAQ